MGRIMSFDVGTKTIGIAKTDPGRMIIQPVFTLSRKGVKTDVKKIVLLLESEQVEQVVVGLPYELDGSETRSARLARQIGDAIAEATGLPVQYVDERYSSVEAERLLIAQDVSRAKRKKIIDQAAAMEILRRYLRDS